MRVQKVPCGQDRFIDSRDLRALATYKTMLFRHLLSLLSLALGTSGLAVFEQAQLRRSSNDFQHPGALHTAADFVRIKAKVESQEEPWYTSWNKLIAKTNTSYVPKPHATIVRGVNTNVGSETYQDLYRDIEVAYTSAVRWQVEGQSEYADSAVTVLDAWSAVVTAINGTSDKYLASGIYGYQLANTAEILRSYSGWDKFDATVSMLRDVFYPMNHEFLLDHNNNPIDHYWANWDLCNIASMQAIGILSDNASIYNEAVDYFKTGGGNGRIENAIWKLYDEDGYPEKQLGQCQESGRDQGHSIFDFALLGVIGSQGYSQGDDLFSYLESRILAG